MTADDTTGEWNGVESDWSEHDQMEGDRGERTPADTPPGPRPFSSSPAVGIADAQHQAWANKLDKGFNTTDVAYEFGLLVAEVGEAFTAWRHHKTDLDEELADVVLYVMAIAEMTQLDLETAIGKKLTTNAHRTYVRDEHGVPVRVPTEETRR